MKRILKKLCILKIKKKINDHWTAYLNIFKNIHFNISLYTYWSSYPIENDLKLESLNAFIQELKKYTLNDYKVYLSYDNRNTKGNKEEFKRLVQYLRKNEKQIKVKKTEKIEYKSCGILVNDINNKSDFKNFLLENCSIELNVTK